MWADVVIEGGHPARGGGIGASAETHEKKKRMNTHLTRCSYDEWECNLEYKKRSLLHTESGYAHVIAALGIYTDAA
jgi:hypothetical protein